MHTFTTAVKSPTNVLFQLANKHRSLPDVPLLSSSLLSFPFLSSPLLGSTLFAEIVISVESLSPDQTRPPTPHPNHIANEHYTPTCLLPRKHPLNSFRGPLPDVPTRSAGWHCVSASEGEKWEERPPPTTPQVRSGNQSKPDVLKFHPPLFSTEKKKNTK